MHAGRLSNVLKGISTDQCPPSVFANPIVDGLLADFLAESPLLRDDSTASLFLPDGSGDFLFLSNTTAAIAQSNWVDPVARSAEHARQVLAGLHVDTRMLPRSVVGPGDGLREPDCVVAVPVSLANAAPTGILRVSHANTPWTTDIAQQAAQLARRVGLELAASPQLDVDYSQAILGPDGRPARPQEEKRLLQVVQLVNSQLFERLATEPALVHSLSPRAFEELA
jgi:hypothetical protein